MSVAVFQLDAFDETALCVVIDADDLALDPLRALRFRALAQEARIETGIEVVGVGNLRERRIGRRVGRRRP